MWLVKILWIVSKCACMFFRFTATRDSKWKKSVQLCIILSLLLCFIILHLSNSLKFSCFPSAFLWTKNFINDTTCGEEQCVLPLSRQAQTHACQDAAHSMPLSRLGHIQQAHVDKNGLPDTINVSYPLTPAPNQQWIKLNEIWGVFWCCTSSHSLAEVSVRAEWGQFINEVSQRLSDKRDPWITDVTSQQSQNWDFTI